MHGKQRELDRLKDEEKELMTDIKKSEREIQRIEDDLKIVQELEEEVQIDMSDDMLCRSVIWGGDKPFIPNASQLFIL